MRFFRTLFVFSTVSLCQVDLIADIAKTGRRVTVRLHDGSAPRRFGDPWRDEERQTRGLEQGRSEACRSRQGRPDPQRRVPSLDALQGLAPFEKIEQAALRDRRVVDLDVLEVNELGDRSDAVVRHGRAIELDLLQLRACRQELETVVVDRAVIEGSSTREDRSRSRFPGRSTSASSSFARSRFSRGSRLARRSGASGRVGAWRSDLEWYNRRVGPILGA